MYWQSTVLYNSHFTDARELTYDDKDAQLDFTQNVHLRRFWHLDVCIVYFVDFFLFFQQMHNV